MRKITHRAWDIHGVGLRIESELPLPRVVDHALRHHGDPPAEAPEISIHIQQTRFPAADPFSGAEVLFARPMPVRGAFAGSRYFLRAGEGGVIGDVTEGRAHVSAPTCEWLEDPTALRTLLPLAMMLPLAARGLFYLHAAVLADPQDRGWVLVGGGGVGKSTTALALLDRGWRCVTDDGALLRLAGSRVEALAFWDELQVDRALASSLGALRWVVGLASHPHKAVVATDEMFPEGRIAQVVPSRFVLLQREAEPAQQTRPCDAAELGGKADLVKHLVEDNPLLLITETAANLEVFARLVGQCRAGAVRADAQLWKDPEAVLARAIASNRTSLA